MKQKSSFFKALGIMLLSVLFATQANAQNLTVTGTVTDNLGPVIGASIQVEGTSNGCITDIDGNYTLPNVPANATLVFSYIGYQTQKIAVGGKTKIDVKLAEDSQLLQEVVVVGYGVQRKSDLTGAVASVKAADALKNTPTGNVSDALQGRMAGVSVLSGSGNPTEDNTIRVRGINSITAETGPFGCYRRFHRWFPSVVESFRYSIYRSIERRICNSCLRFSRCKRCNLGYYQKPIPRQIDRIF